MAVIFLRALGVAALATVVSACGASGSTGAGSSASAPNSMTAEVSAASSAAEPAQNSSAGPQSPGASLTAMRSMSLDAFEQLPIADRLYYASSLRVGATVLTSDGVAAVVKRYWGHTPGLEYSTPSESDQASTIIDDWFSWAKVADNGIGNKLDGEKFLSAEFIDVSHGSALSGPFENASTNVQGRLSRGVDPQEDTGVVQSVGAAGSITVDGQSYPSLAISVVTGDISDPENATYAFVPYVQASGRSAGAWVAAALSP